MIRSRLPSFLHDADIRDRDVFKPLNHITTVKHGSFLGMPSLYHPIALPCTR